MTAQIILFPGKLTNERIADSIMRNGSYKHLFSGCIVSAEDRIYLDKLDSKYQSMIRETQNEPTQTL